VITEATVVNGKVVSEHIVLTTAVARLALSISYSHFGTSPAVKAPPPDEVAPTCHHVLCPEPLTVK
jgi:hypothetical protein